MNFLSKTTVNLSEFPPNPAVESLNAKNCHGKFVSELMAFFLRFANCYTFMLKSASLCLIFVFV
jgi:hypothetical protein